MASIAGIGDLHRVGLDGVDEMEGMGRDEGAPRELWEYLWHMASHALAAGTVRRMMGVRLDGHCVRAVLGIGPVARHADFIDWPA